MPKNVDEILKTVKEGLRFVRVKYFKKLRKILVVPLARKR